jgi:hypothetical protein
MSICCETHCCVVHGCKYGEEDCPVVSGTIKQKYLCERCNDEGYQDIPKTNVGYHELLWMPCSINGLPEGMTWREWLRELLIDCVINEDFGHMKLNVNRCDWRRPMAEDMSMINPDIFDSHGSIVKAEFNETYRNLICVLMRDQWGDY